MIYTEMTPNPAAIKFVVTEGNFVSRGTLNYPDPSDSEGAPIAGHLFNSEYIKGIMIGQNFVTVTKDASFAWEEIIPQIKEQIQSFLDSGEKAVTKEPVEEVSSGDEDDAVRMIKKLLDENIRPAVAMDGGDVEFDSFIDGVVKVKMQGACTGCPSSTATLKMGIEGLLTRMVPEVKSVEAV